MTDLLAHHRALCDRARALMEAKNADYAGPADPWRNLEAASRLGVGTPEQAIFIRLCDKFSRLATAVSGGTLANEGVEDTFVDIINYVVLLSAYMAEHDPR